MFRRLIANSSHLLDLLTRYFGRLGCATTTGRLRTEAIERARVVFISLICGRYRIGKAV